MNHALLVAPILVPLCSLLLAIILRRNLLAVRVLSLSGAALLAAVGLVLVLSLIHICRFRAISTCASRR